MKTKELIILLGYFCYILLVALLTEIDFTNNQLVLDYPLLNAMITYKGYIFATFPLIANMMILHVLFILNITRPYIELISNIGAGIVITVTYVLLLNSPQLIWAILAAGTYSIVTFILYLRSPYMLFVNDAHYLLNYEITKKVIIISTIVLVVSLLISLGKFDSTNPYLIHPLTSFLVQVIQFGVTVILLLGVTQLLTILRDNEYAWRLSNGYIESMNSEKQIFEASVSKSLISSVNFYNKYLQRNFGVTILPIERLYEYILIMSPSDKVTLFFQIAAQFKAGRLNLLRYLRQITIKDDNNQQYQFLSKNKMKKSFGEFTTLIIPVGALLLSAIDLWFK
jgi:hypothetical protein